MAPGLSWANSGADGGELAAAAYTLGIPHPPGFPTYVLLAHPFTLLPIGEVATRTNLFSALCAAMSVSLVTWSLVRATHHRPAAICAGVALALSPLLWSQAIITEVYALNALLISLILAFAAQNFRHIQPQKAVAYAFVIGIIWGLSLGNHPTALFAAPLVLYALSAQPKNLGFGLAGLTTGLLVYTAIPFLAAQDPPVNWGNPHSISNLLWLITAEPYRGYAFSLPLSHLPARILAWSDLLVKQFGWPGLIAIILGAIALWSKRKNFLAAMALSAVLYSVFSIGYNTVDSYLYLLPVVIFLAWLLGLGVDWLIASRSARLSQAVAILAITLPLIMGVIRLPSMDLSHDRSVKALQQNILDPAPPDAVIVSHTDEHTFTLWYWLYAEHLRPDVTVVDVDLLSFDWYSRLTVGLFSAGIIRFDSPDDLLNAAGILERPVCLIDNQSSKLDCYQ